MRNTMHGAYQSMLKADRVTSFLSCLLLCLSLGCAGKAGYYHIQEPRIFRGEWFDYYNRSLWFLQEGKQEEAERDLRAAIADLDGDSWEERTYGVHFIEYFAHRELGILLYSQGRHEEALSELERSLSQAESSRAKFYLNRVRREVISGKGLDLHSPTLEIHSPETNTTVPDYSVVLKGEARDDTFVLAIRVNGEPVFIELSEPTFKFEKVVSLHAGLNEVEVEVEDIIGRKTRRTLQIRADREPPLLLVHDTARESGSFRLVATLQDAGGIRSAQFGSELFLCEGVQEYRLDVSFDVLDTSLEMPFEVYDVIGNVLIGMLRLQKEPTKVGYDVTPRFPDYSDDLQDGTLLAAVPAGFSPALWQFASVDLPAPEIALRGVDSGTETVFLERFYIEGRASSQSQVVSLEISGREMMKEGAREVYFANIVDLQEATNTISIVARDTESALGKRSIQIVRVVPDSQSLGSRLNMALSPFEILGGTEEFGTLIEDRLAQAFVNPRRFRIIDRETLSTIIVEQRLSATDLADPSNVARIGRLQNAELILHGFLRVRSPEGGLEVMGRLVDTETSRVLFEHDVYDEHVTEVELTQMLEGLYLKFANHFPLLGGSIIEVKSRQARVQMSHYYLARPGMRFILYQEGEPLIHPVTGRALGTRTTVLGEATVTQVNQDGVVMNLQGSAGSSGLDLGDKVLAR